MKNKFRMEGLSLTVESVKKSVEFYCKKLGAKLEWDAAPAFAMIRVGGQKGGTIGLLAYKIAKKEGVAKSTAKAKRGIHVEFSTDNLDKLYAELVARGVKFHTPPHDEPWERSMAAYDPDGYNVEFSEGRRGKKKK